MRDMCYFELGKKEAAMLKIAVYCVVVLCGETRKSLSTGLD